MKHCSIAFILILAALTSAYADECKIEVLEENIMQEHAVKPEESNKFVVESADETKFVSQEKQIPCLQADLLKLGFDYKGPGENALNASQPGFFGYSDVFQKGPYLVRCYGDFSLEGSGAQAYVTWARAACHQIVPVRLANKVSPPK